jgi:hypothetical protein
VSLSHKNSTSGVSRGAKTPTTYRSSGNFDALSD